ncbi:glycosyltransferase [Chryseolinea sp. T2]|uniref:glycosyltransferase n=1 Tax=Chryseolinea sp. T2 TaxID=3129255 RepID=UPI003076CE8A
MPKRKKVLFITPYPEGEAPSPRFRFEQYFKVLQSNQIDYVVQSFLTLSNWRIFYQPGNALKKAMALLQGYCRRVVGLIAVLQADFVFIHREASPVGPPIFEWVIAKLLKKRVIYDFDDALWLSDRKDESLIIRVSKWRGKISSICKWSFRISCGNAYLCDFARQFNQAVTLNPTTIDTNRHHHLLNSGKGNSREIIIGWTGSHSTLKYFEQLEPVLRKIEIRFPMVSFLIIANKPPNTALKRLTYIPWSERTEIEDLSRIDIGVMPLPDDEWSKGKCGFKILQYMALGIPSVSSSVGVNSSIVQNGDNGFMANSEQDWIELLGKLIADSKLRQEIGVKGRETVVSRYSVSSNTPTFLSLFE